MFGKPSTYTGPNAGFTPFYFRATINNPAKSMIAISDNMYMQSEQNVNSSFIATNTGSITLNPQDGHVAITGCLSTTVTVCPDERQLKMRGDDN